MDNLQNRSRRFTVGDGRFYKGYFNAPLPADRHVHISMGILSRVGYVTKRRYAVVTTHEQHVDGDEHHGHEHRHMQMAEDDTSNGWCQRQLICI